MFLLFKLFVTFPERYTSGPNNKLGVLLGEISRLNISYEIVEARVFKVSI